MTNRVVIFAGLLVLLAGCSRQETAAPAASAAAPGRKESTVRHPVADTPKTGTIAAVTSAERPSAQTTARAPQPTAPARRLREEAVLTQPPELPLAVVAARHPQVFTAPQIASLNRLGEQFLAATAEPEAADAPSPLLTPEAEKTAAAADPNRRWRQAQDASDVRFRSMFGYVAYNGMMLERAREAQAGAK